MRSRHESLWFNVYGIVTPRLSGVRLICMPQAARMPMPAQVLATVLLLAILLT
jgi:hypothetical protein